MLRLLRMQRKILRGKSQSVWKQHSTPKSDLKKSTFKINPKIITNKNSPNKEKFRTKWLHC